MIMYYRDGTKIETDDPEQIEWVKRNRQVHHKYPCCLAVHPEDGWSCGRKLGHQFDHVAYDIHDEPRALWDRLEADARAYPPSTTQFMPGDLVVVNVQFVANERPLRTVGVIEKVASENRKQYVVYCLVKQKTLIKYGSFKFLVNEEDIKKIGEYIEEES